MYVTDFGPLLLLSSRQRRLWTDEETEETEETKETKETEETEETEELIQINLKNTDLIYRLLLSAV
jgi:hypothetical protein